MSFDINEVILSQYGASPRIKKLLIGFNDLIKPDADINAFYNDVFNILTARGAGLDAWGVIIGISRKIQISSSVDNAAFFGFNGSGYDVFNSSPFYNSESEAGTVILADNAYRELLLIKASANVARTDAASLTSLMERLYGDRGDFYIVEAGVMKLNYIFGFYLQPYELALAKRRDLPPKPAGVSYTIYQIDTANTFGFAGSNMQPFNCGTFLQVAPQ
ncbi:MAG: DUF2612 domain-containing protein [Candidatus Mucispirillum faecigallinarum]|nr:DUF2612 domain-containing protein [Candidatus Mucispirillum faecigallinarum]